MTARSPRPQSRAKLRPPRPDRSRKERAMRLPRWTVYPALLVLSGVAFIAVPASGRPRPVRSARRGAAREAAVDSHRRARRRSTRRSSSSASTAWTPSSCSRPASASPSACSHFRAADRRERRGARALGTATPPQSPVAWSNFITGLDPRRARRLRLPPQRHACTARRCPRRPRPRRASEIALWGDWKFPARRGHGRHALRHSVLDDAGGAGRAGGHLAHAHQLPGRPGRGPVVPRHAHARALDSAYGECSFYTDRRRQAGRTSTTSQGDPGDPRARRRDGSTPTCPGRRTA